MQEKMKLKKKNIYNICKIRLIGLYEYIIICNKGQIGFVSLYNII